MFGLLWPQTTGQDRPKFLRTFSIKTTFFAVSHGTLFIMLATPTDPSVSKDIIATANFAAAKILAAGLDCWRNLKVVSRVGSLVRARQPRAQPQGVAPPSSARHVSRGAFYEAICSERNSIMPHCWLGRHGNLQFLATAVQAPRGDARGFLIRCQIGEPSTGKLDFMSLRRRSPCVLWTKRFVRLSRFESTYAAVQKL